MNGFYDQSVQDVRKAISGKDGRLFVTNRAGPNIFLAEVDTFQMQFSFKNADWQPVGSLLQYAIPTGCSVTLSFTETVIRDDVMVIELIEDMQKGYFPSFAFQGALRRRDGQAERIVFDNCVPDGSVDLMNITPGELVKRSWNFRVNSMPSALEKFVTTEGWKPVN